MSTKTTIVCDGCGIEMPPGEFRGHILHIEDFMRVDRTEIDLCEDCGAPVREIINKAAARRALRIAEPGR